LAAGRVVGLVVVYVADLTLAGSVDELVSAARDRDFVAPVVLDQGEELRGRQPLSRDCFALSGLESSVELILLLLDLSLCQLGFRTAGVVALVAGKHEVLVRAESVRSGRGFEL
jgi:hypothetical protein